MNQRLERLLEAQAETGKTVNRLMLTLIGVGLGGSLTLGYPDAYLLSATTTINIPFAGGASFKALLILGPIVLIAVRAYLEIYVSHWRRLDRLVRRSPTAISRRVPVASPLRHPLLRVFSFFVLYPLVPLVLAIFTYKAMAFWQWGVVLLFLTLIATAVLLFLRFPWHWSYRVFAPLLVVFAIITTIHHEIRLSEFRRPLQLQLADLERSNLTGQDLRSADLRGARLSGADLTGARLDGADLARSELRGTILKDAHLKGADLFRAKMENANFQRARLQGANLGEAHMEGAYLAGAQMVGTEMTGAFLDGAQLVGAQLRHANLMSAQLKSARLIGTRLRGANFLKAQLEDANLSGALLYGANLRGARLKGAILNEAQLEDANLLSTFGLTQPQLDIACGDRSTKLPAGFSIPLCEH